MKTTVKLSPLLGLVMQPSIDGRGVSLASDRGGKTDFQVMLSQDQCAALIFALEHCSELADVRAASLKAQR